MVESWSAIRFPRNPETTVNVASMGLHTNGRFYLAQLQQAVLCVMECVLSKWCRALGESLNLFVSRRKSAHLPCLPACFDKLRVFAPPFFLVKTIVDRSWRRSERGGQDHIRTTGTSSSRPMTPRCEKMNASTMSGDTQSKYTAFLYCLPGFCFVVVRTLR